MKAFNCNIICRRAVIILIILLGIIYIPALRVHAQTEGEDENKEGFTIVIDPGHGGEESGAATKEESVEEKELNLKIALYLREELEKYEGLSVLMTREDDQTISKLPDRVSVASDAGADLMVSIHNNASGSICQYKNGSNVLTSEGLYREELAQEEQELACNILYELTKLGLEDQGILLRESQSGDTYPNGEIADYYGLIRGGVQENIPTIIIEHAFIDNEEEFDQFLSDDDKLRELAKADAKGMARYYGWEDENGLALEPLRNVTEKVFVIVDEDYHHNKEGYKTFFGDENAGGSKEDADDGDENAGESKEDADNGYNKDRNEGIENIVKEGTELIVKMINEMISQISMK